MDCNWILVFALLATAKPTSTQMDFTGCYSEQYVELGNKDLVLCNFPSDYNSMYWFDDLSDEDAQPIISSSDSEKDGPGYHSGQYDLFANGTLVISNVTLQHERMFKVVGFSIEGFFTEFRISVKVKVTPKQFHAYVNGCENDDTTCILPVNGTVSLTCSFSESLPVVHLQWFHVRGKELHRMDYTNVLVSETNITFATVSLIHSYNLDYKQTTVLMCKPESKVWNVKSKIVLVHQTITALQTKPEHLYFEAGSRAKLICPEDRTFAVIWKKNNDSVVAFVTPEDRKVMADFPDTEIQDDGSLLMSSINPRHDGVYTCITTDGTEETSASYMIYVLVQPSPSFIIVDECPVTDCTITSSSQGSVTCTVDNHRPAVVLKWVTEEPSNIDFIKEDHRVFSSSGLFTVTSTLEYRIPNLLPCSSEVTILCSAEGPATVLFHPSRMLTIKPESCYDEKSDHAKKRNWYIILVVAIVVVVLCCAFATTVYFKKRRNGSRKERNKDTHVLERLVPEGQEKSSGPLTKRDVLIRELRVTYEQWITPSYSNRVTNQNNGNFGYIYIPNEITIKNVVMTSSKTEIPSKFTSTYDFLSHIKDQQKHVILEGESGLGKTAFALNTIKQWLDKSSENHFPIVIVLSLRALQSDICGGVVRQLLPTDGDLNEEDIQNILKEEERYLVILDDFETYPHRSSPESEVHLLMRKDKMRNANILLLSRPSDYIRTIKGDVLFANLEKFTMEQISEYLEHVSNYNSTVDIETLKQKLHENKDIAETSKTPLFLSMVLLMFVSEDKFSPMKFETLTQFASTYIETLKSRTTMKVMVGKIPQNRDKVDFDGMKRTLGRIAIRELTRPEESKEEKEKIESETVLCDMGILTTSKGLVKSQRQNDSTESLQFSHDFYKYIFGAAYLASDATLEEFEDCINRIDKSTCQLLLIVTCGLTKESIHVKKIIERLLNETDRYPYPVRDCIVQCICETSLLDEDMMKPLLETLCKREHGLNLDGNIDNINLLNAKANLITVCADLEVPMNNVHMNQIVQRITTDKIILTNGKVCSIPTNVRSFLFWDFAGNIRGDDVIALIKRTKSLQEFIVFSTRKPTLSNMDDFGITKGKKILVLWVMYKEDKPVLLSCISSKYKAWLSLENLLCLIHLWQNETWNSSSNEEKTCLERSVLAEMEHKTFSDFLNSTTHIMDATFLDVIATTALSLFGDYLNAWRWTYETKTDEEEKKYSANLRKIMKEIVTSISTVIDSIPALQNTQLSKSVKDVLERHAQSDNADWEFSNDHRMRQLAANATGLYFALADQVN